MTGPTAAVVQLAAGDDAAANADAARRAVTGAAARGARLVVLPEYASGWAPTLRADLAEPVDGPFARTLGEAAREAGVWVVAGTMEPAGPGRARNVAIAYGPDGGSCGRYVKVHLFDAYGVRESDLLEPGEPGRDNVLLLDVDGVRVGVATCYDLRFPEAFRVLVDAGAQAIAVIAAWAAGPGKVAQLRTLATARAIENTSYLLLSSQGGRGRSGHSAIVDPWGVTLAEAGDETDATLTAELSAAVVGTVREKVPSLRHRRYGVVPRG